VYEQFSITKAVNMYSAALLALKLNVEEQLITEIVIILNFATWSYWPLSIFCYANHNSDNKCVFGHKQQKRFYTIYSGKPQLFLPPGQL
jgi:hypothetical protein